MFKDTDLLWVEKGEGGMKLANSSHFANITNILLKLQAFKNVTFP